MAFLEQQSLKRILEAPSKRRRSEFLAAVKRSRKLHGDWVSPPRTVKGFNQSLERLASKAHVGYWVLTESGALAGAININEIVRGRFRSGLCAAQWSRLHDDRASHRDLPSLSTTALAPSRGEHTTR